MGGAQGGLTLQDLGPAAATPDSVNVTIKYVAEMATIPEEHFLVVSEGTYRSANRKIEAIFKGVPRSFCFDDVCPDTGQPLYYTPSYYRDRRAEGWDKRHKLVFAAGHPHRGCYE